MSTHDLRTIAFLQFILVKSWLRSSARSPFFWIIAIAIGFMVASIVATMLGGGPGDDLSHWLESGYFEAGAASLLLGAALIGLWRGSSAAPRASLADVVLLMGAPVSSRAHYTYFMIRDCAGNGLTIALWMTGGFGGVLVQTGDPWMPLRLFFLVLIALVFSELLRYALWVTTEQVVAQSPVRGDRIRKGIRLSVVLSAGAVAGYVLPPVMDGLADSWRDGLATLLARTEVMAGIPPLSWAANFILGEGPVLVYAIGLLALPVSAAAIALIRAENFTEPIAVNAERATDPRGAMTAPGADVQWAAMAQFGLSPRARLTVPPFGRGPWAILWASIVRWVRYQIAAAWIGLAMLGGVGVVLAVMIRLEFLPLYAGWALALSMPLFSSVNAFMDELRKQFLFLTPGPAWKRLLAGAVTSVLDGLVATLMIILALVVLSAIPVTHAIGLLILTAGLSVVAQAAVALVQVILPYWIPQRVRMGATVGASVVAAIPALVVMIVLYLVTSALLAMVVGSLFAVVSGIVVLALAAILFDRIEFSG